METPKRIPYGKQNWEDVRLDNFYYVDKTRFIAEIEASNEYFFFIRPRRFGKSLLMNMLRQYYDLRKADLFETALRRPVDRPASHADAQQILSALPQLLDGFRRH